MPRNKSQRKSRREPRTTAIEGGYSNEFNLEKRTFGPNCEFGRLLRSQCVPSDHQLIEIRALKSGLLEQIRVLDIHELEKREDVSRLEKEIANTSNDIDSIKQKSKDQIKTKRRRATHGTSMSSRSSDMVLRKHRLEMQAECVYTEISSLCKRRKRISRHILCTSALLAPIRVLPREIMSEIFYAYITPDDSQETWRSPVFLSRLCSAWRSIAISTPQLWTHLRVGRLSSFTKRASSWFERAGELPLSLHLPYSFGSSYSTGCTKLRGELQWIWPRIRALQIDFESMILSSLLREILKTSTSTDSLVLRFRNMVPPQDVMSYFENMHSLRRTTFVFEGRGAHLKLLEDPTSSLSPFPLRQLTHLSMVDFLIKRDNWLALMVACSGTLQHGSFVLYAQSYKSLKLSWSESIYFRSLMSLEIYLHGAMTLSIFSYFRFPSLRSFSLSGKTDGCRVRDCTAIRNVAAFRLEAVKLTKISISPNDLDHCLQHLPNILSLTADNLDTDYNPLIRRLSLLDDAKKFMPKLRLISIKNQYETKIASLRTDTRIIDRMRLLQIPEARPLVSITLDNSFS